MKRTLCSLVLLFCLLAELCIPAFATNTMTVSEEGRAFIDEMQNGRSYDLDSAQEAVNAFMNENGLDLNQAQFDALVDLVIAYDPTILFSGWRIETVIVEGGYTDAQLASAFCSWVKGSNGGVSEDNLRRRLREVKLFLYGSYSGNCEAQFRYVLFNANGGRLDDNSVICYPLNERYKNLPTASRGGKFFAGWYTMAADGSHITNEHIADQNRTLYAHWSDEAVSDPNAGSGSSGNFDPPELKISEDCVNFIKAHEGFSKYAYWDYSQYTIGYGTRCDPANYPDGITEEEADYWLRVEVKAFEEDVDRVLAKGTVQHNQHQYDAILSFTFNLGQQWMKPANKIYQYILFGNHTELEFVNSMGAWASAGGSVVHGLMRRRMDEADMYLNGNYQRFSTTYFGAELKPNEGSSAKFSYHRAGEPLGTLPTATREGYTFHGWFSKATGGTQYTAETVAPSGTAKFYAQWTEGESQTPPDNNNSNQNPTEPPTEPPTEAPTEPPTESTEPEERPVFTDLPQDQWYYSYVMSAVEQGLLKGVSSDCFEPESTMTRAMLVTVLHRIAGTPEPQSESPFTDVESGSWYSKAVAWAYENQIVMGMSDTVFGVHEDITREQLVTMLFRYAATCDIDLSEQDDLTAFPDAPVVSSYARQAMMWAVGAGIINGDDGCLIPTGNATRAQCAKIMVVFSDLCA